MISEKEMENSIIANPEKYLGETGLILLAQQHRIGNYIFDILFVDRHGAKMIVEVQKGTLDRTHTYKILDYYHEYKENNPLEFIELMVVANKIPDERKRRLKNWGVSFKEIPEEEFVTCNAKANHIGSPSVTALSDRKFVNNDGDLCKTRISTMDFSLPSFKPKFQDSFDKSDSNIRDLFCSLLSRFKTYPIKQYTVDKPDYRLCKKYIFCEIVMQRKFLLIELRVDDYHISSTSLTLNEIKDPTRPGKRWLKFHIHDEDQVDEAAKLIDEVYKFSE